MINLSPGADHATQMAHLALLALTDPDKAIPLFVNANISPPPIEVDKDEAPVDTTTAIPIEPGSAVKERLATTQRELDELRLQSAPLPVASGPASDMAALSAGLGAIEPPAATAPRVATPTATVQAPGAGPNPASLALIMELLNPQPAQVGRPTFGQMITGIG